MTNLKNGNKTMIKNERIERQNALSKITSKGMIKMNKT